jgi:hypothetical protein
MEIWKEWEGGGREGKGKEGKDKDRNGVLREGNKQRAG